MNNNLTRGNNRKEKKMNAITKAMSVAVFVALSLALGIQAAEPPKPAPVPDLDKLVGQPADLALWAYAWRADRELQEKPEAYFIPRRLKRLDTVYRPVAIQTESQLTEQERSNVKNKHVLGFPPAPKGGLLSALLWLAPVPTERIELRWPEGSTVPPAEAIEVRVYPAEVGWFGWVCDVVLPAPKASADGRTWSYVYDMKDPTTRKPKGTDMVAVFLDPAKAAAGAKYGCPTIHLFPPRAKWIAVDVEIEWGFKDGTEQAVFDGRIEAYGGYVKSVKPLPEDKGTTMTGADAWKSAPAAGGARRGIVVSLLHPGRFGSRPRDRQAITPLDTRITLWTKSGNLTFMADDVNFGPVLVPEHGVYIAKAGSGKAGRAFAAELAGKNPKSLLEVVRRHKETASCEEALRQIKLPGCREGTEIWPVKPFEEPPAGAMRVQVPDERWNDAWRLSSLGIRNQKGGWMNLSYENAPVIHAADLIGAHDASARRFEYWLKCPGTIKPDGDFVDGDGSFEYATSMKNDIGYSHDGTHTGTFLLLSAMADRYLLTGDKTWFEQNRARMQRAADWLIRQRRDYLKDVPNRDQLWTAGLLPPMVLGDSYLGKCMWFWYLGADGLTLQALQQWSAALEEVDPAAAKRYREEAEAYRQDLVRVVEREMALSPVRPIRDGTYHTYIPQTPYRRGTMQKESFGVYADADIGVGALPVFDGLGVLPADDPRLSGHLEIVEESLLNGRLAATRKQRGLAEEDDVFYNGIVGLAKCSVVAQTHFRRDDIGPFLRFWMHNYAAFVGEQGGMSEWPSLENIRGGNDLGTTAWFITNFRNLLVWEDGDVLWLAKATPRAWLEQGKEISVKNAPTYYGTLAYEIVSDVDNGKISATIEMPTRKAPKEVVLRFRHPKSAPIKGVIVNGKPWTEFNKDKETITLKDLTGTVTVTAQY